MARNNKETQTKQINPELMHHIYVYSGQKQRPRLLLFSVAYTLFESVFTHLYVHIYKTLVALSCLHIRASSEKQPRPEIKPVVRIHVDCEEEGG